MNENLKTLRCKRRREKRQSKFAVYLLCVALLTAVVHWQYTVSHAQDAAILSLSLRLDALERQNIEMLQSFAPQIHEDAALIEQEFYELCDTLSRDILYRGLLI